MDPGFLRAYIDYDRLISRMLSSDDSELSDQQRATDAQFSKSARGYQIYRNFVQWESLARSLPLLSPDDVPCDDEGFPMVAFTNG